MPKIDNERYEVLLSIEEKYYKLEKQNQTLTNALEALNKKLAYLDLLNVRLHQN